jgi:hypothetical protein
LLALRAGNGKSARLLFFSFCLVERRRHSGVWRLRGARARGDDAKSFRSTHHSTQKSRNSLTRSRRRDSTKHLRSFPALMDNHFTKTSHTYCRASERAKLGRPNLLCLSSRLPSKNSYLNAAISTKKSKVKGIPQCVVEGAIGTKNRNELHLTNVDGIDAAKRARSGSHGADRDRDSAPDAGSRGRRNDLPLPRRRIREIRRDATLCDIMRHCQKRP